MGVNRYYIVLHTIMYIITCKNVDKTGQDQSEPVLNQFGSRLVRTGLVTAKDWKRPVYTGPVRSFGRSRNVRTGLGLGPRPSRLKTETGPDLQSLCELLIGLE